MLDTLRHVETPEGIQLSLPIAGPVARARAWVIDVLIEGALLTMGGITLGLLGASGGGLFLIFYFVVVWTYPVLFEVFNHGQTPGKQIVGLRVVHDDGMPIGWSSSILRSIIGFVDMLPAGYAAGLVSTLLHPDSKRLGDMAAGSVVVYTDRARVRGVGAAAAPMRPPAPLLVEEQYGLVEFAARAARLSQERLEELAEIASPLIADATDGADGVQQLLAQARWISGSR